MIELIAGVISAIIAGAVLWRKRRKDRVHEELGSKTEEVKQLRKKKKAAARRERDRRKRMHGFFGRMRDAVRSKSGWRRRLHAIRETARVRAGLDPDSKRSGQDQKG